MDLYGVEKGLEHYRSTQTLTFEQYIYYLQKEVCFYLEIKLLSMFFGIYKVLFSGVFITDRYNHHSNVQITGGRYR